jgi:carbon starvation protein CstA
MGRAKYAWISLVPMIFVGIITLSAGTLAISNIFLPMTNVPSTAFVGYMDTVLMIASIFGVVVVSFEALRRWIKTLRGEPIPPEAFGPIDETDKKAVTVGAAV